MDKTNKSEFLKKLTISAALSALIVIMGLTRIGLIPWFSGASITILQIPVILAVFLAGDLGGIFTSLIFGVYSLIQAALSPVATDAFFVNPLISILPRLLMGIFTARIFALFSMFPKFPKTINYCLTAILGTFANTFFVLTALVIAKAIDIKIACAIFVSNGLLEAAASAIICTAIMVTKNLTTNKKSQFSE